MMDAVSLAKSYSAFRQGARLFQEVKHGSRESPAVSDRRKTNDCWETAFENAFLPTDALLDKRLFMDHISFRAGPGSSRHAVVFQSRNG